MSNLGQGLTPQARTYILDKVLRRQRITFRKTELIGFIAHMGEDTAR